MTGLRAWRRAGTGAHLQRAEVARRLAFRRRAGRPPPIGSVVMTRVLLVRHGQSAWNATGRWQGQADPPLTDLGRAQAHHADRSLRVVDAIVASDLQRAAATALIISGELGPCPVVDAEGPGARSAGTTHGGG